MHIRPEAYFNKGDGENISKDDNFIETIQAGLGRMLTPTERLELGVTGADDAEDIDVDTITRVI